MKFDEFGLYEAIYKVRMAIESKRVHDPGIPPCGADEWYTDRQDELLRLVNYEKDPKRHYDPVEIAKAWRRYRRNKKGEHLTCDLIVQVGQVHGRTCFYANRGKGACSDQIDLDRIVPGVRGGKYCLENCVIACSKHNRERGEKAIEDYLAA